MFIFQTPYNGRVVQNQGQGAPLNSAPVPGAPAARFDGNLPFHGGQGTQQWMAPTMIQQHNIAVPAVQHAMPPPPRPVYPQIQSSQRKYKLNIVKGHAFCDNCLII